MKKSSIKNLALGFAAVTMLAACDEELNLCGFTESDTAIGSVFVESTGYLFQITGRIDEAMRNGDLISGGSATIDNANVTWSNDTITIDFGPNNVSTADGKLRRGKIIGYVSGNYQTSGSMTAINLDNYHVNDVQISGSISLSNTGNSAGNWVVQLSSTNFQISSDYSYSANLSMEWLSGYATDSLGDDSWQITGTSSGADNTTGTTFTAQFTDPLLYDRNCAYKIVQGEVFMEAIADSTLAITIDFLSADNCNNVVNFDLDCDGSTVSSSHTFDNF